MKTRFAQDSDAEALCNLLALSFYGLQVAKIGEGGILAFLFYIASWRCLGHSSIGLVTKGLGVPMC